MQSASAPASTGGSLGERWGGTDAWKASQERTAGYRKEDWQRIAADSAAMQERIVAVYRKGYAPTTGPAMDIAEEHRQWVSTFWDCTYEAHRSLVDMYLADERFTKTYEDAAEGLAAWLRDAAHANADRHESAS